MDVDGGRTVNATGVSPAHGAAVAFNCDFEDFQYIKGGALINF